MELLDRPFADVTSEQCWGLLTCAGTVAANVFSAGGLAVTLRVGNWFPNPDVAQRQVDPEVFYPALELPGGQGLSKAVTLECVTEVHPARDLPPNTADPFTVPLWPITEGGRKAASIGEVLRGSIDRLPFLGNQETTHSVIRMRTTDAFYAVPKIVSSLFGVILSRGGNTMGVELFRGPAVSERVTKTVIEHSGKVVEQRNLDGTISRIPVQRSRNEVIDEQVVPVCLVVNKTDAIKLEDLNAIRANESAYNPSWTLLGLLTGKYAEIKPFQEDVP